MEYLCQIRVTSISRKKNQTKPQEFTSPNLEQGENTTIRRSPKNLSSWRERKWVAVCCWAAMAPAGSNGTEIVSTSSRHSCLSMLWPSSHHWLRSNPPSPPPKKNKSRFVVYKTHGIFDLFVFLRSHPYRYQKRFFRDGGAPVWKCQSKLVRLKD